MLISHPRARCNQTNVIDNPDMLLQVLDYQIISAYSAGYNIENGTMPKHIDRALHNLIEKIYVEERLRIQCMMIGDFLFGDVKTDEAENGLRNKIEYITNRKRLVINAHTLGNHVIFQSNPG